MEVLITRPDHDDTVTYLSLWSEGIVKYAKKHYKVLDYKGRRANRKDVTSVLEKKNPRFVFFNGHGSDSRVCGHADQPLIIEGENEGLLSSKIIYARSCNSAASLGATACEHGADAYVGYEGEFTFFSDTNKGCSPLQDEFSQPFFESSNEIPLSLLKGKSVGEAYKRSQDKFDYWIDRLSSSGAPVGAESIVWALFSNKMNQRVHGDRDKTL